LSQTIVSLASFNGNTRWFACSGILVEYDLHKSVLTSASLVWSSNDENTIVDNLQIEVRLPNGQCVKGTLQYCNLHYNIAVVNNMVFPDFCAANLYHPMEIQTASEVVAVGRLFSTGRLTATRGIITDKQCNFGCNELMISTCKITKAGIGGPVVDFSGNFIGMNFYDEEETPFLPRNVILECRKQFETQGYVLQCLHSIFFPGLQMSFLRFSKTHAISCHSPTTLLVLRFNLHTMPFEISLCF